jgi:lysine-N-methylase
MAILHRTRNFTALTPRYAERFRCIGPSCEDTCCVGWPVHIDKKTYKAYRQANHPALQPVYASMQRLANHGSDTEYAVLQLGAQLGNCPAHQDGMCAVQANLGESYLSDTCQNFPRINRFVNGQMQQSMSLSCPEAARLALLDEDAFDFVEAPVSVREKTIHVTNANHLITPELMTEVRIFCMSLMRTHGLALWQRLALLGTFCDAMERDRIDGQRQGIQALISDFTQAIESGELVATLEVFQPNYEAQAMVFATLWGVNGFNATSTFQQDLMQRISTGLGADASGQASAIDLVAAYRRGLTRLDERLEAAPWVLEHYVINEMFTQLFPVGDNTYTAYLQLVARFGLLRLLLAAQCNTDGELPPLSALSSTVALQCRRFQHDLAYTATVNRSLDESGWSSLDKLFTLIRT